VQSVLVAIFLFLVFNLHFGACSPPNFANESSSVFLYCNSRLLLVLSHWCSVDD